uniref:Uncharacterized protein n=1 Tax=Arundo donax TaxID=35708 RepID=A0A0A9G6A6_ARUDO
MILNGTIKPNRLLGFSSMCTTINHLNIFLSRDEQVLPLLEYDFTE